MFSDSGRKHDSQRYIRKEEKQSQVFEIITRNSIQISMRELSVTKLLFQESIWICLHQTLWANINKIEMGSTGSKSK